LDNLKSRARAVSPSSSAVRKSGIIRHRTRKQTQEANQTSAGLRHFFQERCRSFNTRLALDAPEGKLNFAELFQRAEILASALSKAGCRDGEVMVLALPNSIDFIPSFLALCAERKGTPRLWPFTSGRL